MVFVKCIFQCLLENEINTGNSLAATDGDNQKTSLMFYQYAENNYRKWNCF